MADEKPDRPPRTRFDCWAGQGLPAGWARNMGYKDEDIGDVVWPIVDNTICGRIDGRPRPDQMLCWCPSSAKQELVVGMLRKAAGVPENEDWLD